MLVLASQSELRKMIMELSGMPFKIVAKEIDERAIERNHPDKSHEEIVELLAATKALAVAREFPDDIIIAADTFGVLPDGQRLHKTKTMEDSIQFSLQQAGQILTVNTGTAIAYRGRVLTDLTTTKIKYLDFDEKTIRSLFEHSRDTGRRNSALGFFIDAPGFTLVERIEGSYMGAMGLPMDVVRHRIKEIDPSSRF